MQSLQVRDFWSDHTPANFSTSTRLNASLGFRARGPESGSECEKSRVDLNPVLGSNQLESDLDLDSRKRSRFGGNIFGSVHVCVSVCALQAEPLDLKFGAHINDYPISDKFEGQGHRSKVKVTKVKNVKFPVFSLVLQYVVQGQ